MFRIGKYLVTFILLGFAIGMLSANDHNHVVTAYQLSDDRYNEITYVTRVRPTFQRAIVIVNSETGESEILTSPSEFDVIDYLWSPNGEMIAFASRNTEGIQVYLYLMDTREVRQISPEDASVSYLDDWANDSQGLLISSNLSGQFQVYLIGLVEQTEQLITEDSDCEARNAKWAADTNKIAYELICNSNSEIIVHELDTGEQTNVSNHPDLDAFISWSPTGESLAFISLRDADTLEREIYTVDADGNNLQRRTNFSLTDSVPEWGNQLWSPDGEILFSTMQTQIGSRISTINLNSNDIVDLTLTQRSSWLGDLSSDGRRIIFQSRTDDNYEIFIMSVDEGSMTQIAFIDANEINGQLMFRPIAND